MKQQNTNYYSEKIENYVLGSIISKNRQYEYLIPELFEFDFFIKKNQEIFFIIKKLFEADREISFSYILDYIKDKNFNLLTEKDFIFLEESCGLCIAFDNYFNDLKILSIARKCEQSLINARLLLKQSVEDLKDPKDILDKLQSSFFLGILEYKEFSSLKTLCSQNHEFSILNKIKTSVNEFKTKGKKSFRGLLTNFHCLDYYIQGLAGGDLTIIAGRPSMGKTAFLMNIIENVIQKKKNSIENYKIGMFSLEMNSMQIIYRLISSMSKVKIEKLFSGEINANEMKTISQKMEILENLDLIIDDSSRLSIKDIKIKAKKMKIAYKVDLIAVDYLQLLSSSKTRFESRYSEISEISRELKNIAVDNNIPVICLSQLSRKVEEREGNRPRMSDLRDSGSIEQDADQIILIHRKNYFSTKTDFPFSDLESEIEPKEFEENNKEEAEIIIAKNRHGKIGNLSISFNKEILKFEDK